jgi:hypothetical protein
VRAKYNSTQTPSRFYLSNLNGTMVVMVFKSQAPTPTPDVALPWWGLCDLRWRFPKMRSVQKVIPFFDYYVADSIVKNNIFYD